MYCTVANLKLMKNLNSMSIVSMKKTHPIIDIATMFLKVKFHSKGDLILSYCPEE